MKEKHRLIPVLIFAFILTVLCTAAVSRWYLLHQKGGTYNSILLGKLVSSDGRRAGFARGSIHQIPERQERIICYHIQPRYNSPADKTKDSHITLPNRHRSFLSHTDRTKWKFLLFRISIIYAG